MSVIKHNIYTLTFIRLTRNCYKLVVTIRWQPLKSNLRFHISELYTGYLWTLRNVEGTGVYQVHTNRRKTFVFQCVL